MEPESERDWRAVSRDARPLWGLKNGSVREMESCAESERMGMDAVRRAAEPVSMDGVRDE